MKRKGVNFRKLLLCVKISEFVYLKIDIAMLSKAVSKTRNLTAIQSTPWIQVYSLTAAPYCFYAVYDARRWREIWRN